MAGGGGALGGELAAPAAPAPIVERITNARRRARVLFRLQFAGVWVVLIALIVGLLYAGGRIEPAWLGRNTPFILGGIGITILVSVASIALATLLALVGALGRLSGNAIIYAVSSLYVSLVREIGRAHV
jgi:hypothetical protein